MAEPIYDILFTVDRAAPSVTPTAAQLAGYYGDDKFARVTFSVPAHVEGHRYRIEIVDAAGAYDITELLDAVDHAIVHTIPVEWTTAGIASLQLVEIEIGDDQTETAIVHYPPAHLLFLARDESQQMDKMVPFWESIMVKVESAARRAKAAAETIENAEDLESALAEAKAALDSAAELLEQTADLKVYIGGGDMPAGYDVQIDPNGEVLVMDEKLNAESKNPVTNAAIVAGLHTRQRQITYGTDEPTGGKVGDVYIQILAE